MSEFAHRLDRTVVIEAAPETVFRFFTETPKWAAWWGAGSAIDARPGGPLRIRYPDGTEAVGSVVEVRVPERIVFTYGYASGRLIAPGGSRVTIALEPAAAGTRLTLTHEFADATTCDLHVQGWRYQLSVFANVVADAQHAAAPAAIDAWFDAWANPDAAARTETLARIAVPELRFRDRYSNTDGIDDLVAHIGAAQHHIPGIHMRRNGGIRHCQGMVLADWIAAGPDGQTRASGTSVFVLRGDGRIESVTGFMTLKQEEAR